MPLDSVTVISSPYHVGIRDYAVGNGPSQILNRGLIEALKNTGITVHEAEVDRADHAEGDIGRSFEIYRKTSRLVTAARKANSFPIIVSGNCSATVGVLAGLHGSGDLNDVGCIWFDAHDDYNVPDTVLSGYFDSMPIAIMAGECWKALAKTIPGYRPLNLRNFAHVGLRDLNDMERERVNQAGYPVVWGGKNVDFPEELNSVLDKYPATSAAIHVDLDVLDSTVGQVNRFEPAPGGLMKEDLVGCLNILAARVEVASLTIASFDPAYDPDHKIADIATHAIVEFVKALLKKGAVRMA